MKKLIDFLKSLFQKKALSVDAVAIVYPPTDPTYMSLPWEKEHPERREWSEYLCKKITSLMNDFNNANDIEEIYPGFSKLQIVSKVRIVAELFVWLSFYESDWDPKCQDVDTGTKEDENSWSIGLFQISVCDQKNFLLGSVDAYYDYDDLLKYGPNIDLTMSIMSRQLRRTGKILLNDSDPNRYWSTLLRNNQYNKIEEIKAKLQEVIK